MLKYRIKDTLDFLLYHVILLTVSYFFDRFYQMLIFILFYSFIQNCFRYRFHADTIQSDSVKASLLCKIMSITMELMLTKLLLMSKTQFTAH